jgi:hypothetical protein
MAQQHYKALFKKALLQFVTEPDPFLAMLKWVMTEMMRIEAEAKVGAAKGSPSGKSPIRGPFKADLARAGKKSIRRAAAAPIGDYGKHFPSWLDQLSLESPEREISRLRSIYL